MATLRNYKTVIFKSQGIGTGRQIPCPFVDKTIPKTKACPGRQKQEIAIVGFE